MRQSPSLFALFLRQRTFEGDDVVERFRPADEGGLAVLHDHDDRRPHRDELHPLGDVVRARLSQTKTGVWGGSRRLVNRETGVLGCSGRVFRVEAGVLGCSGRVFRVEAGVLGCSERLVNMETGVLGCSGRLVNWATGGSGCRKRVFLVERGVLDAPEGSFQHETTDF